VAHSRENEAVNVKDAYEETLDTLPNTAIEEHIQAVATAFSVLECGLLVY